MNPCAGFFVAEVLMACFACMPDCDKCIPKFIVCPECLARCMLSDSQCLQCAHVFAPSEKQKARDRWIERLMGERGGKVRACSFDT